VSRPTIADISVTAGAITAGILLLASSRASGPLGDAVIIKSVRDSTTVVGLSAEKTIAVRGSLGETVVRVSSGHVEFLSSPCPHKTCLERGRAASEGDYIVCVPNGVSARVVGKSDFDAVVP
jgi:hypothetical protein